MKTERQFQIKRERIFYKHNYFTVQEYEPDCIRISFEDSTAFMSYKCEQKLKNISYLTIVSALKEEKEILACQLIQQLQDLVLKISVRYEFLNEISQQFVFTAEKFSEQKAKQAEKSIELRSQLRQIKDQVYSVFSPLILTSSHTWNKNQKNQIKLKIPFNKTLISLSLTFNKLASNVVQTSVSYFDTCCKSIIKTDLIPQQLFYTEGSEICFVCSKQDYEYAYFQISGEYDKFDCLAKMEQMIDTTPINRTNIAKGVLFFGIFILFYYSLNKIFGINSQENIGGTNSEM